MSFINSILKDLLPDQETETPPMWHADLNDLDDLKLKLEVDYLINTHLPELHGQMLGPWKNISLSLRQLKEDYVLSVDRLQAIYEELKERRVAV